MPGWLAFIVASYYHNHIASNTAEKPKQTILLLLLCSHHSLVIFALTWGWGLSAIIFIGVNPNSNTSAISKRIYLRMQLRTPEFWAYLINANAYILLIHSRIEGMNVKFQGNKKRSFPLSLSFITIDRAKAFIWSEDTVVDSWLAGWQVAI